MWKYLFPFDTTQVSYFSDSCFSVDVHWLLQDQKILQGLNSVFARSCSSEAQTSRCNNKKRHHQDLFYNSNFSIKLFLG